LFDTDALGYDRARPGYPDALFEDLRSRGLDPGCSVLEVGCGTGQATRDLARVAGEVTGIELGAELAAVARKNLLDCPNVRVVVGAFEDMRVPTNHFDLLFSATAFHWIDPELAFGRAASLLVPSGWLALVTNVHVDGGTHASIHAEVTALQEAMAPELGEWTFRTAPDVASEARRGGDIAHVWARVERSFHPPPDVAAVFGPPYVGTYEWTATYDTAMFLAMLGSQSAYLALDPGRRARLLQAVGDVVERRLGGVVTKTYLAVLAAAPVRASPVPPSATG